MHELSIANNIIEIATEQMAKAGCDVIDCINLEIGALTCVHPSALEFCFEMASKDTLAEGARLKIETIPVTIYCDICDREFELAGIQNQSCPQCDDQSATVRRGKELDIISIEIVDNQAPAMD